MEFFSQIPSSTHIRNKIYGEQGYFLIKNFVSPDCLLQIKEFWTNNNSIDYYFADPICNKDVRFSSPPYLLKGKHGDSHKSYCLSIFNKPLDTLTHEIAFNASILRNSVMDSPIYECLLPSSDFFQQYRIVVTKEGSNCW